MYEIKNWSITANRPFVAPEPNKLYLSGNVYGSEKFADGTWVITSSIVDIEDRDTYKLVKTKNSTYKITPDTVDPEYEKECNNAYYKLQIKQIKQNDDTCVFCGRYVPEGRQVCPSCEMEYSMDVEGSGEE